MNYIDYREALGIGYNDAQKVVYFTTKVLNVLRNTKAKNPPIYSEGEYYNFCDEIGNDFQTYGSGYDYLREVTRFLSEWFNDLNHFLLFYISFLNNFEDDSNKEYNKENYKYFLTNCLEEAKIPFDAFEDEDGFYVFPKGAKELDNALVSEPLEWLKGYPKTRDTFVRVLKQYSNGEHVRDVADNFRKSLEEFLREFLKNNKDLENNRSEICKYLKTNGADSNFTNMLEPLLASYKKINDSKVKHKDDLEPKFLEFVMYQTGLFIRMILTVGKEE